LRAKIVLRDAERRQLQQWAGQLLPCSVALGLWQGNRGVRVAAFVLAFPSIVGAIVLVLLLVVPESSQVW
jgi:hypothetical protein